ncbi:porin family protein [Pedobacter insulae]|uniref:Outer membrane protein beta-barrel domain-containing protein n=1 Tax=Pedobacter insulae TaxID=414048 RepID=A0A1I2X9U3_9SPHI|nr:hypothetical protein [Pedobacter insulae]SFH10293.1 hypothetical protein SAMN04489864_10591 [Pedobacter insulae]
MQPTEHKHKNDVELIDHIKQSLKTHEELYDLGAWEKFNEKQKTKKRPVFWIMSLSGAAAVLAVCITLIWFTKDTPKAEQLTQVGSPKTTELPTHQPQKTEARSTEQQLALTPLKASELRNSVITADVVQIAAQTPVLNIANSPNVDKTDTPTPAADQQIIAQVVEVTTPGTSEFLANESQKNAASQTKFVPNQRQSKWAMGLVLAPSFSNTNELNMGYGISMSYNFSNKLSLSSGIAYNKMSASKNLPTNIGASSIIIGNTKSLEVINEEVVGLDIPLELKYNINKNLYANFGVSGFAVLNQRRNNTFVEQVVVKRNPTPSGAASVPSGPDGASSSTDPSGAKGQFANSYIVNQRTTERASAIQDVNYLGFYTLSFGYTKKVYKNHSLSIEPFVKLPIKIVSQDHLKLMGTGLRLRVGF